MKRRKGYSEGGVVINMKGSCEKEEPDDDMEESEDEPMEMAKGGMVKAPKRKSIQLAGWGKARRR